MSLPRTAPLVEAVRREALRRFGDGVGDEALVREFATRGCGAAFAALVRRHGPMVLGVCRRVLGNPHDADDAFQCTFLVLALKASTVARPEALASWLYGVAYRTAREAKAAAARRRRKEAVAAIPPGVSVADPEPTSDLREALDGAIAALPEKYRTAVVLCDLEGRSRAEAAGQLGIPEGTLSSRLAAARRLLAGRLGKRGLAPAALGGLVAAVPSELLNRAAQAGSRLAAGESVASVATENVGILVQKVVKAMVFNPWKMSVAALGLGVALTMAAALGQTGPPGNQAPKAPPPKADETVTQPAEGPKKFSPSWAQARAYVRMDGDKGLQLRAEIPVFGLAKLLDADNKPVTVHRFTPWQPDAFTVAANKVRVFNAKGEQLAKEKWAKALADETLVLLEFSDQKIDPKQAAETYRLYREDTLIVRLPPEVLTKQLDISKALPPVKSLPQVFPGQNGKPGDPIPPPLPSR